MFSLDSGNSVIKKYYFSKKVLVRERKRHTAHCVASARFADGGGGTPSSLGQGRGVPHPVLDGGVPHPVLDRRATPWVGVPPFLILDGVPPVWTWDGVPPHLDKCEQTETITFPHPSDAGP